MGLSVVDSLVLIFLPVVVADLLKVQVLFWSRHPVLCQVFWACEHLNKVLSMLILVALCVHCYISICQPQIGKYHLNRLVHGAPLYAWCIMGVCVVVAVIMLIPLILHTGVYCKNGKISKSYRKQTFCLLKFFENFQIAVWPCQFSSTVANSSIILLFYITTLQLYYINLC